MNHITTGFNSEEKKILQMGIYVVNFLTNHRSVYLLSKLSINSCLLKMTSLSLIYGG